MATRRPVLHWERWRDRDGVAPDIYDLFRGVTDIAWLGVAFKRAGSGWVGATRCVTNEREKAGFKTLAAAKSWVEAQRTRRSPSRATRGRAK